MIRGRSELDGRGRLRALLTLPAEQSSVPALLAAVEDVSLDVARAALRRLVPLAGPAERDALRSLLLHLDIGLVGDVAVALRELRDQQAAAVAIEALGSDSSTLRQKGALALRELRDPSSVGALLVARSDDHAPVRRLAVQALQNQPATPEIVSALRDAQLDEDSSVRAAAVRAVAQHDPKAGQTLQARVRDSSVVVRVALASVAGTLDRQTVERLLEDREADVRVAALRALLEHPSSVSLSALLACLGDENWHVRRAACDAVAAAGGARAEHALIVALVDPSLDVRGRALVALERCCEGWLDDVLETALPAADSRLRRALVEILGRHGRGAVALPYVDDPSAEVRIAVAHALADVNSSAAEAALRFLRDDCNSDVRNAAAVALERLSRR